MKTHKHALVLSGGGFKGAFQAGAIQYIYENWQAITGESGPVKFDIVAGVSVGSLNGVLVAMDKMQEMLDLWKQVGENIEVIYTSDFIDTKSQGDKIKMKLDLPMLRKRFLPNIKLDVSFFQLIGALLSKKRKESLIDAVLKKLADEAKKNIASFKSLADNTPLHKLLSLHVDIRQINSGTKFLCGSVSLTNGKYYGYLHSDFQSNEEFVKAVLASTVMPIVWEPVGSVSSKRDTATFLVDGGIRNVSPLGDVIDLINADPDNIPYKIFIINCNAGKVEVYKQPENMNVAEIALRSINDIALTEIFNNDISEFVRINDLIQQAREQNIDLDFKNFDYTLFKRTNQVLRNFESKIIQPDESVLGDTLVANPALIKKRIQHGRDKAEMAFKSKEVVV